MRLNRTPMLWAIVMGLLSTAAVEKAIAFQHTTSAMVVNVASDDDVTATDEDDVVGADAQDNDDQSDNERELVGSDYDIGDHD